MTQISCLCHSLPAGWAMALRVVWGQGMGGVAGGSSRHSPGHTAGSCWLIVTWAAASALSPPCSSALALSGHPAGTMFSLVTVTPLPSLADVHTSTDMVCCEVPPALQLFMGDNYLYVSHCLARVNDPITSLLLACCTPQLLAIYFCPKAATAPLISIIKLNLRPIISNHHLVCLVF